MPEIKISLNLSMNFILFIFVFAFYYLRFMSNLELLMFSVRCGIPLFQYSANKRMIAYYSPGGPYPICTFYEQYCQYFPFFSLEFIHGRI